MVLLDLLAKQPELTLIVAHYDHGIRNDSVEDRKLVQDVALNHGLQFVYDEGNLGPNTSEAAARKARYEFLHKVRDASKARKIITAHHQDDLLETAILNILRGTGRAGFAPLSGSDVIKRPLLNTSKQELIEYAKKNNIVWREDSTNQDIKYLRNYIRHKIIPKLSGVEKKELLGLIHKTKKTNQQIDEELISLLHLQPAGDVIDRHWFIMLPHAVAAEVMAEWLRRHKVKDINKSMVNKLVNIGRVSQPNRVADIDKNHILEIGKKELKITQR